MADRVEPTAALPLSAYRDQDVFDAELDRVWRGGWVWVGTVDEVREPGDFFATTVGGQPVIVLRNQAGRLAALSNVCAHRGTLLVEGTGTAKRFQCPYHAWTYRDDGSLASAPFTSADDLDKERHHLPHYRCEEWHGLVFVSLRQDVPSLAERFAHLESFVAPHGLSRLHHWTSRRQEEIWEANWKLVITNAMESYHLFKVHPETLEPYAPTSSAYYLAGGADGTATGGAQPKRDDYTLLSFPPNFVGTITDGSLLYQVVEPIAPDRTRVITGGAFTSPDPEAASGLSALVSRVASKAADSFIPDFLPEDKWICERGQRAASGDFTPGSLVPMEQVVVDFHHYLARQLDDVTPPPPATSATVGIAKGAAPGARS